MDFLLATSAVAVWQSLFCCLAAVTNTVVCGWYEEMVYAGRVSHWPEHFSKRLFSTLVSLIHFGSRSCNIFRQLYIIRHALAVIIWFTISTINIYIQCTWHKKNPVQLRCFWDQRNFQLKGGRCSSKIWCCCSVFLLSILWLRFGMGKKTSEEPLRHLQDLSEKVCFESYSWLFPSIPCYWRSIKMQSRDVLIAAQYGLRRLR